MDGSWEQSGTYRLQGLMGGVGAARLQEALVFHDQESLLLSQPTYVLEFILAGSLYRLPQPDSVSGPLVCLIDHDQEEPP